MTSHCASCGNRLYIEKEIEEATGGTMDICLECVNKAAAIILKEWRDKANDAKVRLVLLERLDEELHA